MELTPLGREIERHLRVVVGHNMAGGDLHNRGDGDAPLVSRKAGEIRLLEPLDAEDRVDAARVKVERPAALVMGWTAQSHRQHILKSQQAPHDDRAVRPGACARRDEPIAARCDRVAVAAVLRDARCDVVRIPSKLPAVLNV